MTVAAETFPSHFANYCFVWQLKLEAKLHMPSSEVFCFFSENSFDFPIKRIREREAAGGVDLL